MALVALRSGETELARRLHGTPARPRLGELLTTSFAQALSLFLAAIPRIVGFLILPLAIGWFLATPLPRAWRHSARSIRFNDMAERSGFAGYHRRQHRRGTDSSGFVADIAKWFIRLMTLVVGFDALGLPAVSDVFRLVLLWLLPIAVAVAVLILGGLAANWPAGVVRATTAKGELGNADLLASIVAWRCGHSRSWLRSTRSASRADW